MLKMSLLTLAALSLAASAASGADADAPQPIYRPEKPGANFIMKVSFSCIYDWCKFRNIDRETQLDTPEEISTRARDLERLHAEATKDNVAAQYILAQFYSGGYLVAKDKAAAAYWYRKAAMNGRSIAWYYLGNILEQTDLEAAIACYERLANCDPTTFAFNWTIDPNDGVIRRNDSLTLHRKLYRMVGEAYLEGKGKDKNELMAIRWLLKAAMLGDTDAQRKLGLCYYKGTGVEKDALEFYAYLNLASPRDDGARWLLEQIVKKEGYSREFQLQGQMRTRELKMEVERTIRQYEESKSAPPKTIGK